MTSISAMRSVSSVVLLGLACAKPQARSPATDLSATVIVEVRRADSILVPAPYARLVRGNRTIVPRAPAPGDDQGRVRFTDVAPGRYLLRATAMAFQTRRDTIVVRPSAIDTFRVYVDYTRCDLDCPEVQLTRRPWWKFWPFARSI